MIRARIHKALATRTVNLYRRHLAHMDRLCFDACLAAGLPALDMHKSCHEYPSRACELCRVQKALDILDGMTDEDDPERW